MEKIPVSWMDNVTNEDVLKKVNESKNMLNVIYNTGNANG